MFFEHTFFFFFFILPWALADEAATKHIYGSTTHGPYDYLCIGHNINDLLPFPYDCHYFIECDVKGHSALMACPDELFFDWTTKKCGYPEEVNCHASTRYPTSTTTGHLDELCHGKPDGWLVPYPYDCSKYLQCFNQRSTLMNCPAGQWFDAIITACNYKHLVDCTPSTPNPPPTTPIPTTRKPDEFCAGKPDRFLRPYPYDCAQFIECVNQRSRVLLCPKGFWFDAVYSKCRESATVNCSPSTTAPKTTVGPHIPSCKGIRDGTLLRHPTDCDKYIDCEAGKSIIKQCGLGYLFDNLIKACNYDYLVDCAKF